MARESLESMPVDGKQSTTSSSGQEKMHVSGEGQESLLSVRDDQKIEIPLSFRLSVDLCRSLFA